MTKLGVAFMKRAWVALNRASNRLFAILLVCSVSASLHGQQPTQSSKRTEPVFQDDFESGTYGRRQPGGKWQGGGSGNVHIERGGAGGSSYALSLIHRAKPPQGMSSAEQRFALAEGTAELWLEYDLFVPANFYHRTKQRGSDNNKFLALWEENYKGVADDGVTPTAQFIVEFRPMNDGKKRVGRPGDSYLYMNGNLRHSNTNRRFGNSQNAITNTERGRWNRVRVHIRLSSTNDAEDGLVELFMNDRKLISRSDLALPTRANGHYLRHGYFMGWANSGYSEDTHFKVDNVRLYAIDPRW
jgi:hypothetical protein